MDGYGLVESVHAVITGLDTAASRKYRDELRAWRANDLSWRDEVREHRHATLQFRRERELWREQDLKQRALDNARVLWARALASNYREVQETVEKLRTVSELAALLAGFAVLATLDFQYPGDQDSRALHAFCLLTSLTVAVELVAVVLCTLLMVAVPRMARSSSQDDEEEAAFFAASLRFHKGSWPSQRPPRPAVSLRHKWELACELPWRLATLCFLGGLPLFVAAIALAAYLKFRSLTSAVVSTAAVLLAGAAYCAIANRHLLPLLLHSGGPLLPSRAEVAARLAAGGPPFSWHAVPEAAARGAPPGSAAPPSPPPSPPRSSSTAPSHISASRRHLPPRSSSSSSSSPQRMGPPHDPLPEPG